MAGTVVVCRYIWCNVVGFYVRIDRLIWPTRHASLGSVRRRHQTPFADFHMQLEFSHSSILFLHPRLM
jgi:hypothetical protein